MGGSRSYEWGFDGKLSAEPLQHGSSGVICWACSVMALVLQVGLEGDWKELWSPDGLELPKTNGLM